MPSRCKSIPVDESAQLGIVITGLEVIERRLYLYLRTIRSKSGHFSTVFDNLKCPLSLLNYTLFLPIVQQKRSHGITYDPMAVVLSSNPQARITTVYENSPVLLKENNLVYRACPWAKIVIVHTKYPVGIE